MRADAKQPLVIVFLKAPRARLVKTRLACEVGAARALRVYRRLAEAQLRRLPPDVALQVAYTPRGAGAEMRAWLGEDHRYRVQTGADLGERLARQFAAAFRRGHPVVLAIGADCPELDADCIHRAIAALRRRDVVLGPAIDGGYYLIGLRRPVANVFRDVPWGTSRVLAVTRRRIRAAHLSCALLERKADIDTAADLRRLESVGGRPRGAGAKRKAGR